MTDVAYLSCPDQPTSPTYPFHELTDHERLWGWISGRWPDRRRTQQTTPISYAEAIRIVQSDVAERIGVADEEPSS